MPWAQQQGLAARIKTQADVVFVLDASGSMTACFRGVQHHIHTFVEQMNTDAGAINLRLAVIAEDAVSIRYSPFASGIEEFQGILASMTVGENNEFTLPAIDVALDRPWRRDAHKIIVIFTDEVTEDGYDPDYQVSRLADLIAKARTLHAKLFMYAPDCPHFRRLTNDVPGSVFSIIEDGEQLGGASFADLMTQLGSSISSSIGGISAGQTGLRIQTDLYNLSSPDVFTEVVEVRVPK